MTAALTNAIYVGKSRRMDDEATIQALSALAQPTRLAVFRLLISHEPAGLPAGEIADALEVPHNTMSTHLSILARTGLVTSKRHSRSIVYQASLDQLRLMLTYLLKDCCGGKPEICAPLIADLSPCCQPEEAARRVRSHK
jgi:ArsR family transcriptional regulator, arsenate/arsenite/antimonite-responsive transcriptional repressor